jgi:hypothetical protein
MSVRKTYWAIALTTVALAGCAAGFESMYDHDSSKDFSSYKNYAWLSDNPMKIGPTSQIGNPLLEPRIMSAVEDDLNAKGYTKTDERESADFVLSFTVGSRNEIKVDSYPSMAGGVGYGYPRHWGGWGGAYYGYGTETSVRQYTKGMLAVDIFDVEERRPVWHGVAEKSINESDREDAEGTIRAAVRAVLAGFPPQ